MKAKVLGLWVAVLLLCALPLSASAQTPDFEAAAVQLRQGLENRDETVTVSFLSPEPLQTPAMDLFWAAVEHTGVPTQGDYLRWHLDGMDYEETLRELDGGYEYTLTYTPRYFSTAQQEQLLTQGVQTLLAQLDVYYASDYHKARAIYRYICDNVVYDEESTHHYSAYAALLEGRSVCQGYATLFYRLALELGLDCRVISGQAGGEHHGWNIVKIRDKYYCLDATWDAGGTRYIRFLKGSKYFYFHAPDAQFQTEEFLQEYPVSEANYAVHADCTSEHSFGLYRPNRDATCTENATQTATCQNCEVTDTCPLPDSALGHSYGDYTSNGDATMYADGTKSALCGRCGQQDTCPDPGSRLPKNGWLKEDGAWYYYRKDTPCTGWLLYGKLWYYLKADGEMATGWLLYGNSWYYLKADGEMATGWLSYGGSWYYLKADGEMATGWVKVGSYWYHLASSGRMTIGWLLYGNRWYYLRPTGEMVTGSAVIGGQRHIFDENGIWGGTL